MDKIICVYSILHEKSGRRYVGGTVDYKRRISQHRCDLKKSRHHSFLLQRAWDKYGESAFVIQTLEVLEDSKDLDDCELKWILSLKPFYNSSLSTKRHCLGRKNGPPSAETRQKIREAITGFKHSEETRRKLSELQKGIPKVMTDSARAARVKAGKANILNCHTPSAIAKMAATKTGSTQSWQSKGKRSAALLGKPWSPARRAAYEDRKGLK